MSNDIAGNKTPMEQFQERVADKLKKDIGDMLPPEVLQQMTARAVEEQFFKPRTENTNPGGYNNRQILKPSWFVEEVAKIAEPIIKDEVQRYINAHTGEIEAGIKEYLSDQNLTLLVCSTITSQMQANMWSQVDMIMQAVVNGPR